MAEIGRSFDELQQKIKGFNSELRASQTETRALDRALKIDPYNVDLVKQKYAGFASQLATNKEKAEALQNQMAALKIELDNGTISQENYDKKLKSLTQQSTLTEIEVSKLEGALKRQNQAISQAQFGGITKGMQQAQQAAGNLTTMMGGLTAITGLFGSTSSESSSASYKAMQKIVSGVSGVIGILPMLQQANSATATSFQKVTTAATLAAGAVMMGFDLIQNWKDMGWLERILKSIAVGFMVAAAAATVFKAVANPLALIGIAAAVATGVGIIASVASSLGTDLPGGEPNTGNVSAAATAAVSDSIASSGSSYSNNSTITGDTNININIYDADKKGHDGIIREINTYFTNKKMANR